MTVDIFGTRIQLNFSFFLTVTLMLLFCRQEVVLLCLLSSMLHEIGHLLFMIGFGRIPTLICFGAFGVRIEAASGTALSYGQEAWIAMGGIAVNALLALCGGIFYRVTCSVFSLQFLLVNVMIAGFNIIPVGTLDFARAIRCFLLRRMEDEKAEKILDRISYLSVSLLLAFAVIFSVFGTFNPSLIAVSLYLLVITFKKKWS
ncbi:MAG: hypothetical protein ACI4GB_09645 [Acutalibacteraceae bacterium]